MKYHPLALKVGLAIAVFWIVLQLNFKHQVIPTSVEPFATSQAHFLDDVSSPETELPETPKLNVPEDLSQIRVLPESADARGVAASFQRVSLVTHNDGLEQTWQQYLTPQQAIYLSEKRSAEKIKEQVEKAYDRLRDLDQGG